MLKEVSEKEALKAYMEGKDVLLVEGISKDKDRNPLAFDLTQLFKGKHFLIESEAEPKQMPEPKQMQEPEPKQMQEPEPKQEMEQQDGVSEETQNRRRVDVGKIKALHNAGWTNKAIADEMGINPMTVGKYVKQFSESVE